MMKIEKYLIYCLLFLFNTAFVSNETYSQNWEGYNNMPFAKEWIFNANFGYLSYFGDLSIYDSDIPGKIEYESGRAVGLMVTRRIFKPFGFSAQFLTGELKASKGNVSFKSSILEYNISAYLNILSLFNNKKFNKLELQVFGGIGNFLFKSTKYEFFEGETIESGHQSRVPEFVYFTGAGIHYNLTDKIGIMSSLSLRQCQNDKIDVVQKNFDFDYYSYLQFGITYRLKRMAKHFVNNKARIAHNHNNRLKPLK